MISTLLVPPPANGVLCFACEVPANICSFRSFFSPVSSPVTQSLHTALHTNAQAICAGYWRLGLSHPYPAGLT